MQTRLQARKQAARRRQEDEDDERERQRLRRWEKEQQAARAPTRGGRYVIMKDPLDNHMVSLAGDDLNYLHPLEVSYEFPDQDKVMRADPWMRTRRLLQGQWRHPRTGGRLQRANYDSFPPPPAVNQTPASRSAVVVQAELAAKMQNDTAAAGQEAVGVHVQPNDNVLDGHVEVVGHEELGGNADEQPVDDADADMMMCLQQRADFDTNALLDLPDDSGEE